MTEGIGERGLLDSIKCLCSVCLVSLSLLSLSLSIPECSSETLLGGLPIEKLPGCLLMFGLGKLAGGGTTLRPRLEPLWSPVLGGLLVGWLVVVVRRLYLARHLLTLSNQLLNK